MKILKCQIDQWLIGHKIKSLITYLGTKLKCLETYTFQSSMAC